MSHPLMSEPRADFNQRSLADQREHLVYYITDQLSSPASLTPGDEQEFLSRLRGYARRCQSLPGIELKRLTQTAQVILKSLADDGKIH